MAARKPDSEVGPLGVWAYNTRTLLELSDEQAARAAGVVKATIRKIEGGSTRNPSQRLLHELYKFYKREGERLDLPVEEPPGYRIAVAEPLGDQAAVVAAIDRQTKAIEGLTAAIWATLGQRPTSEVPFLEDLRAAALSGVEEGFRRAGSPVRPDPERPDPSPAKSPRGNGQ